MIPARTKATPKAEYQSFREVLFIVRGLSDSGGGTMQVLLGPLVLLVVAGILGLTIRKRNKSTKQKILATVSIAVVAVGFGLYILFSAASKYSGMMEIDDERWFGADEVFSANFSEAKPLRGACPKPSSPDFDK